MAIDLYCGLGGWTDGLLAAGWRVVGFDIERHRYPHPVIAKAPVVEDGLKNGGDWFGSGENRSFQRTFYSSGTVAVDATEQMHEYPGQLVLQDALTLHGSQLRNADLIVASPPCTEYSYMAMPWSRAKQIARALRGEGEFPEGYKGSRTIAALNALFDACFRIQREACEAAGRHIPLIVENVRGAQPWVGRATWNYGSYYLWGDVPALMPIPGMVAKFNPDGTNHGTGSWFAIADSKDRGSRDAQKVPGFNFHQHEKNGKGGSFQTAAVKVASMDGGRRTDPGKGARLSVCGHSTGTSRDCGIERDGVKVALSGRAWFAEGLGKVGSASPARKAASAQIAKIPFALAKWIGEVFLPVRMEADAGGVGGKPCLRYNI